MENKKHKILTAGIGYIIGGLLIKGIAFITTPLFTRLVTQEEFGMINRYLSIEAFIVMLVGFQINTSYKSAKIKYQNDKFDIDNYHSLASVIVVFHTIICLIVANVFHDIVSSIVGIKSVLLLNLLVLNAFGAVMINLYNSYVALDYSYKKYVVIALLNAITNVVLSVILILTVCTEHRAEGRIYGYAIPYILIGCLILYLALKNHKLKIKNSKEKIKFVYTYDAPLVVNGVAETVLGQYGKLSIDKYIGLSEMGIYSLSYNIYSIIGVISVALDYVVGPFYFEKRKLGDIEGIKSITNTYFKILGIISILIMFLAPEITLILGGKEYQTAMYSAIPLVVASYIVFCCYTVNQEILFNQKTKLITIISLSVMITNIVGNSILVRKFGIMGASYTTLLSYLLQFYLYYLLIRKVLKQDVFDWKRLFKYVLTVLLISFIALFVCKYMWIRIVLISITFCILVIEGIKFLKKSF